MKVSCVIKVGGSLLDLPDLPARLSNYLADLGRPCPVLVCGGGEAVDIVRRWDRLHALPEEEAHWLAVRALTLTGRLLETIVPGLALAETPREIPRIWKARKVPLLDPYRFLRDIDESSGDPLPRRWRVTSDSIAARMAARLEAPEVILLKSAALPERLTVEEAARTGLVDPHFPVAAREVDRIIAVSFRGGEIRELVLEKDGPSS